MSYYYAVFDSKGNKVYGDDFIDNAIAAIKIMMIEDRESGNMDEFYTIKGYELPDD